MRVALVIAWIGVLLVACDGESSGDADTSGDVSDAGDDAIALDIGEGVDGCLSFPDCPDTSEADTREDGDPFPEDLAATLQQILDDQLFDANAPGATLGVRIPGYEELTLATGLAAKNPERAAVPEDRFRIGSMTKTFTAAAVLLVAEEGLIDLDDSVTDYLPQFELSDRVTIRRLLNHTAGVFNYTDDTNFLYYSQEDWTAEEIVQWALDHGSLFEPGTDYTYSNTGFHLLGLMLETVTGQTYAQVVRERLLDPLGLEDSFVRPEEEIVGGMVDGHSLGAESTDQINMIWAWAAGGMVSNVHDICEWATALYGGRVLTEDSLAEMTDWVDTGEGDRFGAGLGLRYRTRSDLLLMGHTGSTMGFNTDMFFHAPSGICVTGMTNDFFGVPEEFTDAVWAELAAWLDAQ